MEAVVLSCRGLCVGLIIVQRSPTECGVSECDREVSTRRRPRLTRGCRAKKIKQGVTFQETVL